MLESVFWYSNGVKCDKILVDAAPAVLNLDFSPPRSVICRLILKHAAGQQQWAQLLVSAESCVEAAEPVLPCCQTSFGYKYSINYTRNQTPSYNIAFASEDFYWSAAYVSKLGSFNAFRTYSIYNQSIETWLHCKSRRNYTSTCAVIVTISWQLYNIASHDFERLTQEDHNFKASLRCIPWLYLKKKSKKINKKI